MLEYLAQKAQFANNIDENLKCLELDIQHHHIFMVLTTVIMRIIDGHFYRMSKSQDLLRYSVMNCLVYIPINNNTPYQ